MIGRANGLTHAGVLNSHGGSNFASAELLDFFAFVGHHTHHTTKSFRGIFAWEVYRITSFDRTGINAEEAEFTDEWIGLYLKDKTAERFAVRRFALFHFARIGVGPFDRRNVYRRG